MIYGKYKKGVIKGKTLNQKIKKKNQENHIKHYYFTKMVIIKMTFTKITHKQNHKYSF